MNELPLVSVIVPVYKTEKYLKKCLDSICNQSYKKLEIICVNDGSPDNSADILREYAAKDSRIIVVTRENGGLSAARNRGLEIAQGDYITGVDSDDYLDTDIYHKIFKNLHSTPDIICYGTHVVNEKDEELSSSSFDFEYAGTYKFCNDLLFTTNVCFWNKLYKRELIQQLELKFPEGLLFEDTAWFYTCAAGAKNIHFSKEKGYFYVQREGSITNTSKKKIQAQLSHYPRIFQYVYDYYAARNLHQKHAERLAHLLAVLYDRARTILTSGQLAEHRSLYQNFFSSTASSMVLHDKYPVREILSSFHRLNPFYKRSSNREKFCFLWFPVVVKRKKKQSITWSLFGITIFKKRIFSTIEAAEQ